MLSVVGNGGVHGSSLLASGDFEYTGQYNHSSG